jgi:hypothetical protein
MLALGGFGLVLLQSCVAVAGASSREIFDRRIAPLLKTANPSSCAECHLGGVDLKHYIAETEAKTFASLRDQGLVDLKKPDDSKILRLIRMASPNSALVTQQARTQEYEAFRDWIRACAADPKVAAAPRLASRALKRPPVPDAVIRHGRIDRVLERFEASVWAQQQRCAGCHAPGSEPNRKHVAQYGDRMNWLVRGDPRATLTRLIERRLVDSETPVKSLLLAKPTMEVPHGGGRKMMVGDEGYKTFRRFVEDYAAIVKERYRSAQQLPPAPRERFVATEFWLKMENTPAAWGDRLLGVDLYAYDETSGRWSRERVATSDRQVAGQWNLWQHNLDLVVPAGGTRTPADLSQGRYRVRIYVDRTAALQEDWTRELRQPQYYAGELELTAGWRPGYENMKVVDATNLGR